MKIDLKKIGLGSKHVQNYLSTWNICFKLIEIGRDKVGAVLTKGKASQQNITILNMHAPNTGTPNFIQGILMVLKIQVNSNSIIVGIIVGYSIHCFPQKAIHLDKNQIQNSQNSMPHMSNGPNIFTDYSS